MVSFREFFRDVMHISVLGESMEKQCVVMRYMRLFIEGRYVMELFSNTLESFSNTIGSPPAMLWKLPSNAASAPVR